MIAPLLHLTLPPLQLRLRQLSFQQTPFLNLLVTLPQKQSQSAAQSRTQSAQCVEMETGLQNVARERSSSTTV